MNATLSGLIAIATWVGVTLIFIFIRHLPIFEVSGILCLVGCVSYTAKQVICREDIASYWRRPVRDYLFWICGAGLYSLVLYFAFAHANVFEANILNFLWPIFLVLFSVLLNKEAVHKNTIIGMLLGFAGIITIFLPHDGQKFFSDFNIGHAAALVGAMIWALYSTLARKKSYPVGFLAAAFFAFSVICFALHFTFEKTVMPSPTEWALIVLMGLSRTSYGFWEYGMRKGNVILLASVSYFLPLITSVLFAVIGYGPHQPFIGLGAAMIIIGCLCVNAGHLKHLLQNLRARV